MKNSARWTGITIMLLVGALTSVTMSSAASQEPAASLDGTALLVIDIQAFYFADGMVPLVEPVAASLKAQELIQHFRKTGQPVIHVQHLPKGVDGTDLTGLDSQYRIHPNVSPRAGEAVIGKHHANSFRDTKLLKTLRDLGVSKIVVCGMQTHMCVEAAVRAAADLGFEVTVAHDACATRDLVFDGVEVPSAQVHAAALAAMQSSYATLSATADLCRTMPTGDSHE